MEIKRATRTGVKPIKKQGVAGCNNPRWEGGVTIDSKGRALIYSPNHPHPTKGRYCYRYRLVVESHLGRFLRRDEVVHHINGNHQDDRLENLQVLSPKEHNKISANQQKKCGWSRSFICCVLCETKEIPHKGNGFCDKCYETKRKR